MTYVGALPNEPGAQFRGHLNSAQQDLARWFAGATEPDPKYSYQWWLDTSTMLIKHRNSAGSAWATAGAYAADGTVTWYVAGLAPGAFATLKANFAATVNPTTGDDTADGYSAGSLWVNTTAGTAWICRSAALGAALWLPITTTLFGQSTAGLVPGPTSAEVTAGKLLRADGTWVSPEWSTQQLVAPPSAAASIELTGGSQGSFRRLRARFDGLQLSAGAAVTAQLRVGGSWRTASSDYDWAGTFITAGTQIQTGGSAVALPLSYSSWPAISNISGELLITTQDSRPIISARGAYTRTGGRGIFDLDCFCDFTGSVDGVRLVASAGTFTAAGRLIVEGGLT